MKTGPHCIGFTRSKQHNIFNSIVQQIMIYVQTSILHWIIQVGGAVNRSNHVTMVTQMAV